MNKPLIRNARIDMRLEQPIKDKLILIAKDRNINISALMDEAFIIIISLHEALKKNV